MKKLQTTWNLKLLYKGDNDPQIEKDIKTSEKAIVAFEKKYKGKDFTSTPQKLKDALRNYEELCKIFNTQKPRTYIGLRLDTDSENKLIQAKSNQLKQRMTLAFNRIAFFRLVISKIKPAEHKKLLKNPLLNRYAYLLEKIFEQSKYNLSEGEERLENLLSQPGESMWTQAQEKLLNAQSIVYKGEHLPVPKAVALIPELPQKDRYDLHKRLNELLKSIGHVAEAELNAIYSFKKIMDELRGYKHPFSSTLINYETDEKTIENLINVVTDNLGISHRFYKLHAKLLGMKKTSAADRTVKIGHIDRKFDFASSIEIVRKSFAKVDPKYPRILDQFVENGQFDIYPRKGKRGGAYCAGGGEKPTYILLNHNDDIRSFETIAHEMGHAFHSELSKSQPAHYEDYTMATAEVASTFFEQVALDELEGELDDKEYATLLHNKILRDITTIFTQVAFFNCELEMHQRVRKEGYVAKEDLAKIMSKHFRSYLGNSVEVTDEDGYFFVRLPHIRYSFYVYTYAYGLLISKALFEKWKKDPSYIKKIETFLSAGGSMSPKEIFKGIGINTSEPNFFKMGLKSIERDIEKLEKLSKKLGK